VYSAELDVLGFDKYWTYEKQDHTPYMWAEANNYWYRGIHVAKLKGGNIYTAPEIIIPVDEKGRFVKPEPKGKALRPIDIDAMVSANQEILEIIVQTTIKKILTVYDKYKDKLDLFHVAYSGGKDSAVLLDLVKKALPKDSFVVIFGDTGMEFPDTYDIVEKTKLECKQDRIPFYIAKSHLEPEQSWKLFGPPSRALRWCCSVHKSTPQTLKLREITGKSDYTGLAFVGVRAHESITRSEYDYENYNRKQKGQYSHNSILEWTSAEVWTYIFSNYLQINKAYKKGNARAGCLLCPMSVKKGDYIKYKTYPDEVLTYIDLIKESSGRNFSLESYISDGGWVSRRSGRDLFNNDTFYTEVVKNGTLTIRIKNPKTNYNEWMKTINQLFDGHYTIKKVNKGFVVELPSEYLKKNSTKGKLFKQVFRKSAYCIKCGVCQANCPSGHLMFENDVKIKDCTNCLLCHEVKNGCLAYDSLRIPKEEKTMSINCFDSVLPKNDWFLNFFEKKNDFWSSHGLGPNQVKIFKRFLKDAELTQKNEFSQTADLVFHIGWETEQAWGIILTNLGANNPQFQWYINNLELNQHYCREEAISLILESNPSPNAAKFVYNAYGRLLKLPFGSVLKFGFVTDQGDLVRTKCTVSDPRVILYALFKFAEKCNDYKEFTLSTLLNDNIERDGISPTRIFGLDREEMIPILLGLSAKYPEFITASFTHDLEKITLADNKNSADVLDLFRKGI
jgi:phosphoadenosine phosphosulfate reductase